MEPSSQARPRRRAPCLSSLAGREGCRSARPARQHRALLRRRHAGRAAPDDLDHRAGDQLHQRERDGPWMLSLNPFDPHPPFDPPKAYLDRYDPEKLPPAAFRPHDIERQKAFAGITQQTPEAIDPTGPMPKVELTAEERLTTGYKPPKQYNDRIVKAAYYAMIELIDTQFGRLIDALEASGQLDDTIIVFHSDHGETLGDHGPATRAAGSSRASCTCR
ncbi:MAG: sulfatase-like hydrolase/transferase [Geminicoccaceae bacterium]